MKNDDRVSPEASEIEAAFFADGYQLAKEIIGSEISTKTLYLGIKQLYAVIDHFLELFLDSVSKEKKAPVCMKGCAWCCHQAVFAQTHEFEYLKSWLKLNIRAVEIEAIMENSSSKYARTSKLMRDERSLYKSPCPLLLDNECKAYAARPMACRIYISYDLESCRYEYKHPEDKDRFPQVYDLPLQIGRKLNEGFSTWLKEQGKEIKEYSLEEGLIKF